MRSIIVDIDREVTPTAPQAGGLRPPLKWAGGKRWQVPHIRRLWEPHRGGRFVEPFCGGLAMALGLGPEHALLNDVNPHLINFYRWLQRGLTIDRTMENAERAYYRDRDDFNALVAEGRDDSAEAAGLFYYLNRTGFNGLCRFSRHGAFNVPFGRYARISYVTDFTMYRELLKQWIFTSGDAESTTIEPTDFVYADPPYDASFAQYAKDGFGWQDQERTALWLYGHRGPTVLVNRATDRVERLYRKLGFDVRFLNAPRRLSCTGDRTPVREIVASRNL